jgi:four helix bundle protein
MNYQEWEQDAPPEFTGDLLWKIEAYRLALFACDLAWSDVTKLYKDTRALKLSDQLYRAVDSIGASVAEGYSRGSGKERAHFYEYAWGSARESRHWYNAARHILGETVTLHRVDLMTQVTRLLLTMIPDQRTVYLKEAAVDYADSGFDILGDAPLSD